jgi:hypothetical protein
LGGGSEGEERREISSLKFETSDNWQKVEQEEEEEGKRKKGRRG